VMGHEFCGESGRVTFSQPVGRTSTVHATATESRR